MTGENPVWKREDFIILLKEIKLMNDFTNKIINGMYVKERDFSKIDKKAAYWICVCPICKKDFSVRGNHLTDKKKPTSKCANCSRA